MKYYDKEFKSAIVLNSENYGQTHFVFNNVYQQPSKNMDCEIYPDGVITLINPKNNFLSLSFDNGLTWINSVLNIPVKNVKRLDKEMFLFEIINGEDPTEYGITYDMFMNYDIIPVGTDDDTYRINCKNRIENKPLTFVRNSLYLFNQENRNYTKILVVTSNYCSLHDSTDGFSVCLFIPNSSGYSVKKFNNEERDNISYVDLYDYVYQNSVFIGSILGFKIIKSFDNNDCFIIITTDFNTKIDIPSANIFGEGTLSSYNIGFVYP